MICYHVLAADAVQTEPEEPQSSGGFIVLAFVTSHQ